MTIQPIDQAPEQPGNGELLPRGLPGLDIINDWVKAASAASQLVRPLVTSDFVPKSFKPDIARNASPEERQEALATAAANATSAVLYGMSLGLDPLVSLQQIYVVYGRPGMYTKMKVALVTAAGHEVWDEEYAAERVTVCGRRKGWPDDRVVRITITIEDAKRAGWTKNDTYTKTPADMLWSRAAARVVDRIAGDLLQGIQSIEDIEPQDDRAEASARPAATSVTAAAILAKAEAAKPQLKPEPAPVPPVENVTAPAPTAKTKTPEQKTPMIRPAQRDRLTTSFDAIKVTEASERTAILAALAGRVIQSSAELTAAEAETAVDQLAKVVTWSTADAGAWVDQQLDHAANLDQVGASAAQAGGARG